MNNPHDGIISRTYGHPYLSPDGVASRIHLALKNGEPLSLNRLGDVMTRILSPRRELKSRLQDIGPFVGIPYPLHGEWINRLVEALKIADILGLTTLPAYSRLLAEALRHWGLNPPAICEAFVMDTLFRQKKLIPLLGGGRIFLVGRSAAVAAAKLPAKGIEVVGSITLEGLTELDRVLAALLGPGNPNWDVVLVGAGVPARILCPEVSRHTGRVALDIGHVMDFLANPDIYLYSGNRQQIKQQWLQSHGYGKPSPWSESQAPQAGIHRAAYWSRKMI